MNSKVLPLALLVLVFCAQALPAQDFFTSTPLDTIAQNPSPSPIDPLGRMDPRSTVTGLFKAWSNEDYLKAYRYFDFSNTREPANDSLRIAIANKIEVVLNAHGTISPVSIISSEITGDTDDGLNSSVENIGTLDFEDQEYPLLLNLVETSEYGEVWLVSDQSVGRILAFIERHEKELNQEILNTTSRRWKGAAFSEWLTAILMAIGAFLLAWLITFLARRLIDLFTPKDRKLKRIDILHTLLLPLRLILAVSILVYFLREFGISIVVRQAFSVVNLIVVWTALFLFVWLLINTASNYGEHKLRDRQSFGALSAVTFFKNSAKFVLIVVAILIVFHTLGFNITGAFAALGVGGLALALGAQKTIENIVGGLSVVFDQPVSVGDFCSFGATTGTVEKIGMRSTRIRTSARTVVTVPNSDFSSQSIENFSKRDLFLFDTKLGLRYETSPDQIRYILIELRKMLYAHPKVDPNPARVRFTGFGSSALEVGIFAYFKATDYGDFLGIQEDINLRIADIITSSGSGFAFPSQTLYISEDNGISQKNKEKAEKQVQTWSAKDEMPLPEFDPQTIASLKDTLEYPKRPSQNPSNPNDDAKNQDTQASQN